MAILEAVFANKAGQTPQEVERRRRMAQALIEAGSGGKPPSSGLELAGRLAMTLTGQYQAGKAERQDATNRASASTLLANTLLGTPGQTGGSMPSVSPSGQIAAKPTAGKEWDTVAPRLVSDLSKDFQLTPEQAAGVVGQLGHESAGFGTMQEVNPTVPGSRGGYGYAQWTGPRRKEFEAWTGNNGLDPNSYEANYGFLKNELANSPEGVVLRDLRSAPDAMTAGRVFTDKFLRPGTPNYGSRDAWTQKALAFANQPTASAPGEVASLDQSIGIPMPGAAGQMRANAPAQPMPQSQTAPQAALPPLPASAVGPAPNVASVPPVGMPSAQIPPEFQNSQQLMNADPNKGIMQALLGGSPASPQQVAQAQQVGSQPQAMGSQPDRRAQIAALLQNPYTQEMGQQMLMQEYQQQQEEQKWRAREDYKLNTQRADPSYKLEQDYKQAQLEALKAKTGKRANVTNLGDGWLWDNDEKKAFRPQDETDKPNSGFRFGGNSVEAQALNGLIESGQITADQAQQLGAGKTITDPSTGAMMFLTPQGIFKQQQGQQGAPQAQQPTIDLFGDGGANAAGPAPQAVAPPAAGPNTPTSQQGAASANPGIIPLTGGKPQKLLTEGERKNQSLFSVIKPELQVVEDNYNALADTKNQAYSKLPFSEFATTPEYQKAANSLQTIVSSYLYSVSGATATPEEVRKQTDILTPRPGESKESIENKKRRVRTMVNAVAQAGSLPPLEEPQAAAPTEQPEDLSTMPVPEGMDENVWKFVPPEDRKLWLKK